MPSALPQILTKVLSGGAVMGLQDEAVARASFTSNWGAIRAIQVHLEGCDAPAGALVNNLVSLNLGGDATCGFSFEGRDWEPHQIPHRGVTVIPARLSHAARSQHGGECLLVELAPEFVAEVLKGRSRSGALPMVLGERDGFAEHVLLALAEQGRRGDTSRVLAESLGTALVTHLADHHPFAEAAPALQSLPSPTLGSVLQYVTRHLDRPLSLERLASVAGMDLFRFARAFKLSTGSSPHRYLLEARITRAKALLADRAISITDIALQTGFATPSHFSVTFRRITGVTPRAFRDGLR